MSEDFTTLQTLRFMNLQPKLSGRRRSDKKKRRTIRLEIVNFWTNSNSKTWIKDILGNKIPNNNSKFGNFPTGGDRYIHTYLPTYLNTYLPTYIHTYIPTYLPKYLPKYLPTYLPTYIHTYIQCSGKMCLRAIRLRNSSSGGNSSSGWNASSSNSSSEFVFGGDFVFWLECVFEQFVFGIRLRRGIRLRGDFVLEQLVFGIRLRNSSSSAGRNVIPAPRPQCIFW